MARSDTPLLWPCEPFSKKDHSMGKTVRVIKEAEPAYDLELPLY